MASSAVGHGQWRRGHDSRKAAQRKEQYRVISQHVEGGEDSGGIVLDLAGWGNPASR